MGKLEPWYVTGFCDGEAAFTYSRNGGTFAIYFGVKQKEDSKQIIDDIWGYFGYVGNIYRDKGALPRKNSGFTKPSVYYRVTKIDELKIIVDHFDKYPIQSDKKRSAYNIWRDMVMHKLTHYRSSDYDILRKLAAELSSVNSQSRAFKVHTK